MKKIQHIIVFIVILLLMNGCGGKNNEEKQQLKIAAASNLMLAFTEIEEEFEEEYDVNLTFSYGSSGQLTDQIENGAPFDVFASANIQFMDYLREKELILTDTETTYAFGRIGLASLKDGSFSIQSFDDLLNEEVKKIAIANPNHAPYGLAAKEALESLGLWDKVEEKLVYGRNISDTLTFIETGNAEVSIIALSLYDEETADFVLLDDTLHHPISQTIAVIKDTEEEELAKEFIRFIQGSKGKPILESYGFTVREGD